MEGFIIYKIYIEFYSKNKREESTFQIIDLDFSSKKRFLEMYNKLEGVLNS